MEELIRRLEDAVRRAGKQEEQFQRLKQAYETLQIQVDTLTAELVSQQQANEALRVQIQTLQQQASHPEDPDRVLLRERIDGYLRDIDACLKQLGE
ncbi:MAG: hypothetical protein SF053_12985 [Bacteroidia bacterium]|nr:hypothetical protein [Bacteroidia bacterium]